MPAVIDRRYKENSVRNNLSIFRNHHRLWRNNVKTLSMKNI